MAITKVAFYLDKKAAIKNGHNIMVDESRGSVDLSKLSDAAREWLAAESSPKEAHGLIELRVMGYDYRLGIGLPTAEQLIAHMEGCAVAWAAKKAQAEEEERNMVEKLRTFILASSQDDLLRMDGYPKRWGLRSLSFFPSDCYYQESVVNKVRAIPEVAAVLSEVAKEAVKRNAALEESERQEKEQKRLSDEAKATEKAKARAVYESHLLDFVKMAQANRSMELFNQHGGSNTSEGDLALARYEAGFDSWVEAAEEALVEVVSLRLRALGATIEDDVEIFEQEETTHPSFESLENLKSLRRIIASGLLDIPMFEYVNVSNAELCHVIYDNEKSQHFNGNLMMIEWSFAGLDKEPLWASACNFQGIITAT